MSWLVAPRWTCAAAGPSTASVSAAFSGTTGLPEPAAAAAIASASKFAATHAAAIASASSALITPALASASRERRLGVEHRLQPALVRDCRGRLAACGDRLEHAYAGFLGGRAASAAAALRARTAWRS